MVVHKTKIGELNIGDTFFLSENPATHIDEAEMIVKAQPDYYVDANLIFCKNKNVDYGGFGFKSEVVIFTVKK